MYTYFNIKDFSIIKAKYYSKGYSHINVDISVEKRHSKLLEIRLEIHKIRL